MYGVIPGGDSFNISQGPLSDTGTGLNQTVSFNWTVDITNGTDIVFVGGDNTGIGTGGFVEQTVGSSGNDSCLSSTSPSSTAGSPAGGTYPTGTGSSSGTSSSTSGSHPKSSIYPTSSLPGGSRGDHS